MENNMQKFLAAIVLDSALNIQSKIVDLIQKYKHDNIDLVPISEIENCIKQSIEELISTIH